MDLNKHSRPQALAQHLASCIAQEAGLQTPANGGHILSCLLLVSLLFEAALFSA